MDGLVFWEQDLIKFKIVIKDLTEYDIDYYKENQYGIGAKQLAYCVSYQEVIGNFADFNGAQKGLVYSQTGLIKEEVEKYLEGKIFGLKKEFCFTRSAKERKRNSTDFDGSAEMLQLCDVLTSSTRGLCCSLFNVEKEGNWVKNALRKNIHYHIPDIKERLKDNKNVYFPTFSQQKFVVYKWTGGNKGV